MGITCFLTGASGVTIYLHNSANARVPHTGIGTPWTTAATTPFLVASNDVTGADWIPTAGEPQNVFAGGPPFADGQSLAASGLPNVVEVIPLQGYATNFDAKIALVQLLRIELGALLAFGPATFVYLANGASQATAYRVVAATVQELPALTNEEARTNLVRIRLTLTRHPHGGRLGSGFPAFTTNPASVANTGTGSPGNLIPFTTLVGEDQYAGQPLNLRLSAVTSNVAPIGAVYLASAFSRQYLSSGASASTASGTSLTTLSGLNVTGAMTRAGLKARLALRLSSINANAELFAQYQITTAAGYFAIDVSQAVTADTTYIDLGDIPIDALRDAYQSGATTASVTIDAQILMRSLTGTSVTVGISYAEVILYWEWAILEAGPFYDGTNRKDALLTAFPVRANLAAVALSAPVLSYVLASASGAPINATGATVRGDAPRARQGASLYVAWQPAGAYAATHQMQVTATYAPVYHTLRGNA